MRIEQLRQFVTIAEKRNFRKASKELGISQPALTRSIQNLEHYFNVPLFDRLSSGVILTEYGNAVLTWAQETVDSSLNIKRFMDLLSEESTGTLVVGTGTYFADSLLALALSRVVKKYPALNIRVVRDTGRNAEGMLLNRQIDLFLGWINEAMKTGEISKKTFDIGPIALFCRKHHPLTKIYQPDFGVILKYKVVAPLVPDDIREQTDRLRLEYTGEDRPLVDIEFDSYSEIRKIVELSDCVGGIPESSMMPYFKEGLLKRLHIDLPGVIAKGTISYLKGRTLLPAAEYLVEELLTIVEQRQKIQANA